MTREYQEQIRRWVRENLNRLGWSQAELSRRLNKRDASYIGHSMTGARNFKAQEVSEMEKLFGNTPSKVAATNFLVEKQAKSISLICLGEIITSGFREASVMELRAQHIEIPTLDIPGYDDLPKEAWLVDGDAADLYVQSGNFVVVVDYFSARAQVTKKDKVVIKRFHPLRFSMGDMTYFENSIRMVVETGGAIILKSLSSNPDIRDIPYDPDDKSVVIQKLVIGGGFVEKYQP
jgi:hypothetical protein